MGVIRKRSEAHFKEAQAILVGGVNSPVRAFKSVGGVPVFAQSAKGAVITTEDKQQMIDYIGSWGPMILGHAPDQVCESLTKAIHNSNSFGMPTVAETKLAELVQSFMPSLEKIRFVNSGTEATMSAIRLARGVTGRDIIVKCEGCYHGHVDSLLVSAGSGALTLGEPDSAGIPKALAALTRVCPYNDVEALKAIFKEVGNNIAAVIVEPIAGNMGLVPASHNFLSVMRSLTEAYGSLLIFDEVMSGFRVDLGGAQALYNIVPDLSCLGKVIGGGLPCAAYGGKQSYMDQLAPLGAVYQAGTLSGNPLAMAAGYATLSCLKDTDAFAVANQRAEALEMGIRAGIEEQNLPCCIQRRGTMLTLFLCKGPVTNLSDVQKSSEHHFRQFFNDMLNAGIYWPPSLYEAAFISSSHSKTQIDYTVNSILKSLTNIF